MEQKTPKISVVHVEDVIVATLTDEKILDESDIMALEKAIMPLVEQNPSISLVISFANVEFLSSAVLGLLIRISKTIYEKDGRLRLCSISPKILNIFKITRLDKIFEICRDDQMALRSLGHND